MKQQYYRRQIPHELNPDVNYGRKLPSKNAAFTDLGLTRRALKLMRFDSTSERLLGFRVSDSGFRVSNLGLSEFRILIVPFVGLILPVRFGVWGSKNRLQEALEGRV